RRRHRRRPGDAGLFLRPAAGDQRAAGLAAQEGGRMTRKPIATTEVRWVRNTLIGVALVFVLLFLVLPLAAVFAEALRQGFGAYLEGLKDPHAWSAIRLTL